MAQMYSALTRGRGERGVAAERRRNLIAVSLAAFLGSVGMMVVMPSLPGLLREVSGAEMAASGLWLGLAISISPLMTAIFGPIWSSLGARFGRKAMLERSVVCIGVGVALIAYAATPVHVVALRALVGALGGISVAALAAITATTPRRDIGPAVGTLQAAQTAGNMFGPLLGGVLGALVGMRESFLLSGLVFLVALGLLHWLYRELPPLVEAPVRQTRENAHGTSSVGVGLGLALGAAFILQFVEGGFMLVLPLELERLGIDDASLPVVFGVALSITYLAATISAAVGGRLAARYSPLRLLCGIVLISIVLLIPMAFTTSWVAFVGLRVALGLAAGAGPTLAYAVAAGAATPEQRSRVVSFASSAGILGWAASPIVAGALMEVSPVALFGLDAALFAILAVVLFVAQRGLLDRLAASFGERSFAALHWPGRLSLRPSLVGPRDLLDRLQVSAPRLQLPSRRAHRRFTANEVADAITGKLVGPRADAALVVAAQPSRWMPDNPTNVFREVPRYADRVPAILFQVRKGEDPEEIGRRMSPLGGSWPVKRTVELASDLIARELNR